MGKLQKFEEFQKNVQAAYSDDFPDLQEINLRYLRLNATNNDLWKNNQDSGGEIDSINN